MDQQEKINYLEEKVKIITDESQGLPAITKALGELGKKLDSNFSHIYKALDVLNSKVDELAKNTSTNFVTVGSQLEDIKTEINKIEKVSNYTDVYKNHMTISK